MANFTRFTTFPIFCHQSITFLEKSKKFAFLGGGTLANFWSFQLFRIISHKAPQNDPQWHIWPKSGLDWVKMANFGHFAGFSIFSPKVRLRLTRNGQFHPIHSFPHLLPPKHLISGEISKISISGGGGTLAYFWSFSTVLKLFHTKAPQNDPQWQIWPKK